MLLDIQYRMHPSIAAFPSQQYYSGRLRSGVPGGARKPIKGIEWPVPKVPVAFLPVQGQESPEGNSFTNMAEVHAIEELLRAAVNGRDLKPSDIGIITPYAAQARHFKSVLGLHSQPAPGLQQPEVSSVDGFQGREKDLILVSCVRSNKYGRVGFVGDPRRMNVTLTRAKRGLVVCGNFETLSQDNEGWRPWLSWAQARGLIVGCEATSETDANALKDLDSLSVDQLLKLVSVEDGTEAAKEAGIDTNGNGSSALADTSANGGAGDGDGPVLKKRPKSKLLAAREEANNRTENGEPKPKKSKKSKLMQAREQAAAAPPQQEAQQQEEGQQQQQAE